MNEIVNKFLITRDKFMPEMHLRQPGFTYTLCRPFTKQNKKEWKQLKKQEIHEIQEICQNELDKVCFQYDMVYGYFKNLTKRTASEKILHDKRFSVAKKLKCNGYQCGIASVVYTFFDNKNLCYARK